MLPSLLASIALLMATDFAGPDLARETVATCWTTHSDSLGGFTVSVPSSWHLVLEQYRFARYLTVFLSVNNQLQNFNLHDRKFPPDGLPKYFRRMAASQLKPGMIYVTFAHSAGGPLGAPHYGEDQGGASFESSLAQLSQDVHTPSDRNLDFDQIDFVRWGTPWHIYLYCMTPYSPHDRSLAIEMIKSLRFRDVPIVSDAQAIGVALRSLPPEAEPDGDWPSINTRRGKYRTTVTRVGAAFSVTLVLYVSDASKEVSGQWTYLVQADGTASAQP